MTLMKSGILALAAIAIAFIVLLATRGPQSNGPNFDIVGQLSPPVEGETADGGSYILERTILENRTLPRAKQTWVAINFFASWCTGCVVEHDELIRFHEEGVIGQDGIKCETELVGVAFNDRLSDIQDFFSEYGGDWPVLVDEGTNRIAIDFSVLTAPETVLVAPNGVIVRKIVGPVEYSELTMGITC